MKFFSWMKSKIHGKDNTIMPEPESTSHHLCKEETTACSSTLLSIGTFGNSLEDSDKADTREISADQLENTAEKDFERELRSLLNEHASTSSGESEHFDLPMEKMLESFRVHKEEEEEDKELVSEKEVALLHRTNSTGKDIPSCSRKGKDSIYKKSISFLLRKAFVCGGGFAPAPILRDPFLDTNLDRSRMEKILKTVLRKKKHPQRQKYLDNNRTTNKEEQGVTSNANNWVKTDSEYTQIGDVIKARNSSAKVRNSYLGKRETSSERFASSKSSNWNTGAQVHPTREKCASWSLEMPISFVGNAPNQTLQAP